MSFTRHRRRDRIDHYRRNVVYITSKELVADFLRDQIALGSLRSSTQTVVGMLMTGPSPIGCWSRDCGK